MVAKEGQPAPVRSVKVKSNDAGVAPQPVAGQRARALLLKQLRNGPKPGAQIKAAAQA